MLTTGEIGRAMVDDMAAHGGLVTHLDLAEYTPLVRPPVRRTVGEWDLAVNPPPSVGGPMLAVMLGELQRRGNWHWPDIIDIQRSVLRYRRDVHDLAHDLDAAGHELLLSVDRHGLAGLPTSSSTANVSVVDRDGTACAVTVSSGYGAGVTVPGTGLLLNNALGRARAQQARAAPAHPGHPARLEHGAHHRAHRRRSGARHRLARGRPDHDRPDAGARPGLPARRRPPGTPSRPRACTCASTRTASPSSSTRRMPRSPTRCAQPGCTGATTASSRCSSVGSVRPTAARTACCRRPGDPRREAAVDVVDVA